MEKTRYFGPCLLALLLGTAPAALAQGGFGSPATYPSGGSEPNGLAVGDLNGDNRPDLVVANNATGTVQVLLNQAAAPGTFAAAGSYAVTAAEGVALGDLDLDGRPDVAVCSPRTGVAVLYSAGTAVGSFRSPVTYDTGGSSPGRVVIADLNGDNRPDLAVTNIGSSTVGVLLNAGSGTLAPAASYLAGGSNPIGLAVGDLNGDGRPDLAVANAFSNTVSVLLGSAASPGTFSPGPSLGSGGTLPVGVALADLNRDGRLDVLAGNVGSGTVGVLLASAAAPGTFAPVVAYPGGGSGTTFVAVADLNRDGWPDVVASNQNETTLGVLLGQPAAPGTLGVATAVATGGSGTYALALADVDADNRADAVATHLRSSSVAVLRNGYTPLGTTPALAASRLAVYPNPASGTFTVTGPLVPGTARLELLDALGRLVWAQPAGLHGPPWQVEAANLAPGLYTLRLLAPGQALTQRVELR